MNQPVRKNDRRYNYGDYLTWPENERWEIIDGVAYKLDFEMSASPTTEHQNVILELAYQFRSYLENKSCKVFVAPFDVRIPGQRETDEAIEAVVQPDVVVICDKSKLDERGYQGVPELIIEVISPSTAQKDLVEKLNLYEKTGVKEYWIVHPTDKTVMVFKIEANGKYGRPETYTEENKIKVGIFTDLIINLAAVFNS